MYLYYLISIDLELSRSFNSLYYKAYSYKPGLHYLLHHLLSKLIYRIVLPAKQLTYYLI